MKKTLLITLLASLSLGLQAQSSPKREMRGTWIATVDNIDWPLKERTNPEQQKADLLAILDNVEHNRLNTIVFQIRPTADAFYDSAHEPWSHWLTGTQGESPAYDPLALAINECDRRGITVHVWINPYRVWLNDDNLPAPLRTSLYDRYEGWLVRYGKGHYLHPADARSRAHITAVVADIVRKYDIDAVHMDDYFYPYRVAGEDFPDEGHFRADPRGFTRKADWRRDNVDATIRAIADTIRAIKPWVEFGISPFGIWRNAAQDPRGSATRGMSNYDDLYADILKWQQRGWIDYVSPQLYWHIGNSAADYRVLARWWNDNAHGVPVYVGHALYRVEPGASVAAWRSFAEIVRQIRLNRTLPHIRGSFLYSAKFLARHELQTALKEVCPHRALWPENPRIAPIVPAEPGHPRLSREGTNVRLAWQPEADDRRFVVYRFEAEGPTDFDNPARIVCVTGSSEVVLPAGNAGGRWFVSALSLTHHESEPVPFN